MASRLASGIEPQSLLVSAPLPQVYILLGAPWCGLHMQALESFTLLASLFCPELCGPGK